ncbi:MAG: VTT domain-containing protein [Dehalococcoidia bacterium]|nr:VTT domain-containing protein [Dehalococcoidia bacterium]
MTFRTDPSPGSEPDIPPTGETHSNRKPSNFWTWTHIKYLALLIIGVLIMLMVSALVQRPSNPEEYLATSGYLGVFLMAVIGSASPIWPLPGSWAAFLAAGLGLNPFFVGIAAGLGEPVGELAGYTAGFGSQVAIKRWKRYGQIESWMKRRGGVTILVVSAVPNFFIKLATAAAGALRYPISRFLFFAWIGKTIKSLAFAFAGAGFFEGITRLIERFS